MAALAEACVVAYGVARSLGNQDLAVIVAAPGEDAARRLDSPALAGFTAMASTGALSRLGARHRAQRIAGAALERLVDAADPSAADTATAEAAGMLHLSAAQMAAKSGRVQDTRAHLVEAAELAERIEATPGYSDALTAADRRAALHFDLARAYGQAGGARHAAALRHLDTADRVAPQRIRHDPVARELLAELDYRARVQAWELKTLKAGSACVHRL